MDREEKIAEKMKEVNDIKDKVVESQKNFSKDEDIEKHVNFFSKVENLLKNIKEDMESLLNRKEKEINKKNPDLKNISKIKEEKENLEKKLIKSGKSITDIIKTVSPQDFLMHAAKEILELIKNINKKMEEFDKKMADFVNKTIDSNKEAKMKVDSMNLDRIKIEGLLGITDETLDAIDKIDNFQDSLIKSGFIDKETAELLHEKNYDKLTQAIPNMGPTGKLVSFLVDFNKEKDQLIESLADFVKNKAEHFGIPASNVFQNQVQDMDANKAQKLCSIISKAADKVPHPYAQAVKKGAEAISQSMKSLHREKTEITR